MLHAPIASTPPSDTPTELKFGPVCTAGRHADGGCSPVEDACHITTYSISPELIPDDSRAIRSKIARSASASFPATDAIRPPARTAFAAPEYDFNAEPISNTPNTNMNNNGNTTAASTNTAPPSPRDRPRLAVVPRRSP